MFYIYDNNFTRLDACEVFSSMIWRRKYSECGDFEVHIPILDIDNFECFKEGNLVCKEGDNLFGVIEVINIFTDDKGIDKLSVKGRLIDMYVGKRLAWGIYNFDNVNVEEIVNSLFIANISNPTNAARRIDRFFFRRNNLTEKLSKQVSYKNLLETLEDICITNDLGFRTSFNFDEGNLYLELYKGLDRTIDQSINDRCIFSKDYENILSQEYVLNSIDYKNVCLVAGEGEGSARKLITAGNTSSSGLYRNELYVDARDLQKEDNTDTQYNNMLTERGKLKLSEFVKIESFNGKVNVNSLVYKVDFDLGDKVTFVDNNLGLVVNNRIVEIEEVYENTSMQVFCKFGEGNKTIIKKIRRGM